MYLWSLLSGVAASQCYRSVPPITGMDLEIMCRTTGHPHHIWRILATVETSMYQMVPRLRSEFAVRPYAICIRHISVDGRQRLASLIDILQDTVYNNDEHQHIMLVPILCLLGQHEYTTPWSGFHSRLFLLPNQNASQYKYLALRQSL